RGGRVGCRVRARGAPACFARVSQRAGGVFARTGILARAGGHVQRSRPARARAVQARREGARAPQPALYRRRDRGRGRVGRRRYHAAQLQRQPAAVRRRDDGEVSVLEGTGAAGELLVAKALKKIGRYKILSELGRGAMGVVYKAEDPNLDRTVALKTIILDKDAEGKAEYQKRFLVEAKAAGKLNHPHIVTTFDFGEADGMAYLAMDY